MLTTILTYVMIAIVGVGALIGLAFPTCMVLVGVFGKRR